MYSTIAQGSSTLVIRGIVALIFGIVALFLPVTALLVLVVAFGVYAFVDGVSALMAAFTRRNRDGREWLAVEGVAGIVAGVITFFRPASTAVALIALVSAWALVTGIMKIVLAIRLRKEIRGEWLLALSGVVSLLLGGLIIATPAAATIALIWTLGIYALVTGGLMIALSVRVRQWEQRLVHGLERAA
jgi:uncharacterized membrane protein HdeD (DUF308 family)